MAHDVETAKAENVKLDERIDDNLYKMQSMASPVGTESSLLQEQDMSGAGASTGLSAAEAQEEAAIAALNQELFQENRKSAPEF